MLFGITMYTEIKSNQTFVVLVYKFFECKKKLSMILYSIHTFIARCFISTAPFLSTFIGWIFMPAIWALAGLVPWAEVGIKHTCSSKQIIRHQAQLNIFVYILLYICMRLGNIPDSFNLYLGIFLNVDVKEVVSLKQLHFSLSDAKGKVG